VNKRELVAVVAKRLGLTKAKANEITELFFAPAGLIATELRRGGKVTISG
jgi:nucleoid DNA-binding protein